VNFDGVVSDFGIESGVGGVDEVTAEHAAHTWSTVVSEGDSDLVVELVTSDEDKDGTVLAGVLSALKIGEEEDMVSVCGDSVVGTVEVTGLIDIAEMACHVLYTLKEVRAVLLLISRQNTLPGW
jgi:hypothetical protein